MLLDPAPDHVPVTCTFSLTWLLRSTDDEPGISRYSFSSVALLLDEDGLDDVDVLDDGRVDDDDDDDDGLLDELDELAPLAPDISTFVSLKAPADAALDPAVADPVDPVSRSTHPVKVTDCDALDRCPFDDDDEVDGVVVLCAASPTAHAAAIETAVIILLMESSLTVLSLGATTCGTTPRLTAGTGPAQSLSGEDPIPLTAVFRQRGAGSMRRLQEGSPRAKRACARDNFGKDEATKCGPRSIMADPGPGRRARPQQGSPHRNLASGIAEGQGAVGRGKKLPPGV
jgi:hypothetical protein